MTVHSENRSSEAIGHTPTDERETLQRTKGVWDKSANGVRALIVLTIILCVVAPVYGALRLFSLN